MIFSRWSDKGWLSWFSMGKNWNTVWIRCWGNCLQLLGFWNFSDFFRFFSLKLVYFWTKSRKNIYGCFFHSFCATDFNFGNKNYGRLKYSTLQSLIFASYWGSPVVQFSKFNKFLWVCWFLGKHLADFVYSDLKLHNLYCHNTGSVKKLHTVLWLRTPSWVIEHDEFRRVLMEFDRAAIKMRK